ncbi:MAG: hypothetical protein KKF80_06135, partial [Candidatus Omnitrophica bacterium]|nr:hypothetical protein [Candidatus Omnitrophota bacterium]
PLSSQNRLQVFGNIKATGGVQLGDDTTCDVNKAGTVRYKNNKLQLCQSRGNAWVWLPVGGDSEYHLGEAVICSQFLYETPPKDPPNPPCVKMNYNPNSREVLECSPGWVINKCCGVTGNDCCIRME